MTVRRVGYAKLGRSLQFDLSRGDTAGNAEAIHVLERLATRNPHVEWYVVGKNNGYESWNAPPNVINLWPIGQSKAVWLHGDGLYRCSFCKQPASSPVQWTLDCCDKAREVLNLEDYVKACIMRLDGLVIHVGQHGVVHAPIPTVNETWDGSDRATPYAWARNYGHYLIDGFNRFCCAHENGGRGRVVWLTADPRNFFKARDIMWPTGATNDEPVLSQYAYSRDGKHERYLDPRTPEELGFKAVANRGGQVWKVQHHYQYSGLELAMLPDDWRTWGSRDFDEREPLGVATTAAYLPDRRMRRSAIVQDWVFANFPEAKVYGHWSDKSLTDVTGVVIENELGRFPDLLASWRTTISLPPTGTVGNGMNWCVAKPYQCFAARSVCFFIPPVDAQGWVLPNTRCVDDSRQVASDLWSMRDDWTDDELHLARWLRVTNPGDFARRVEAVSTSRDTWNWITSVQRALLERRWNEHLLEETIERRLGINHESEVTSP